MNGPGRTLDARIEIQAVRCYRDYSENFTMEYNVEFKKVDPEGSSFKISNVDPRNLANILTTLSLNRIEILE